MPSYAITGSFKGIGLEYVRQLAANPANIALATVRDPSSPKLSMLASEKRNIRVIKGDVTNPTSILNAAKAAASITGNKLDVLIHNSNAVDMATMSFGPSQIPFDIETTKSVFDLPFRAGICGSLWATNAFMPLIENGNVKQIVHISTVMADLNLIMAAGIGNAIPYPVAKAGMNVQVAKYTLELAPSGITVLALNPGWVGTFEGEKPPGMAQAMSIMLKQFQKVAPGVTGQIQIEESVKKQLQIIDNFNAKMSGLFFSHNGDKSWFSKTTDNTELET